MTRKLFGTDGVRGVAGEFLSAELALALGRAATARIGVERPQVLIIRDTRESGDMLQAALAAGVSAAGGDVLLGGVLPTPAAPLLIGRYGFDLAVVLSASHNPYRDNGIKFFAGDGYKLSDETELEIERALDGGARPSARIGRIRELSGAAEDYLRELHSRFSGLDLDGVDVLLDCANGATYQRRSGDLQAARRTRVRDRRHARRAATSTPAAARRTSTRSPSGCARATMRSASPSTATAIACSPSTATARSSTATS